jgi:predicted glycosyltransferase
MLTRTNEKPEALALRVGPATLRAETQDTPGKARIWIDLDNSPHVPFFLPIIEELQKRNYHIVLTGRDCFQVNELVQLFHLNCKMVGHHSGKLRIRKLFGLCARAIHMAPFVLSQRPLLALSHGSRSQLMLATLLRIPTLQISDYEHATGWALVRPTWFMHPDVISDSNWDLDPKRILNYPGIKEDVYVPRFEPDPSLLKELGISEADLVITLRPPADEAHYHNPESERLFVAVLRRLEGRPDSKIILLPRNGKQEAAIRKSWSHLFTSGKLIIPPRVVDGLNLIWYSDLVISGGGTMNREAAALGIPVYSIFRGKIGAVDRHLAEENRLILIENVGEVFSKIALNRRNRDVLPDGKNRLALDSIVQNIVKVMEHECQTQAPKAR